MFWKIRMIFNTLSFQTECLRNKFILCIIYINRVDTFRTILMNELTSLWAVALALRKSNYPHQSEFIFYNNYYGINAININNDLKIIIHKYYTDLFVNWIKPSKCLDENTLSWSASKFDEHFVTCKTLREYIFE